MEFISHAQQRAFERFGVLLTARDFKRVLKDIKKGYAQCIGIDEKGRELYNYPVGDSNGVWVINKRRTSVITILRTKMYPDNEEPRKEQCPKCNKKLLWAHHKVNSNTGWWICENCKYATPF